MDKLFKSTKVMLLSYTTIIFFNYNFILCEST